MIKQLIAAMAGAPLAILAAQPASAGDFSKELTASYTSSETGSYENDLLLANLDIFLAPVSTDNVPLAEAAFLGKASSVSVLAGYSASDYGSNAESSGYPLGAGITYVLPQQPLALHASFSRVKEDLDNPYSGDVTTKVLQLGAGYYVQDNAMVALTYAKADSDINSGSGNGDATAKTLILSGKYIADLGAGQYLNLEPSLVRQTEDGEDDVTAIAFGADFYPVPETSIGAGMSQVISDQDGTALYLTARTFIQSNTSLQLTYTNNRIDDSDIDSDSFEIAAAFRF